MLLLFDIDATLVKTNRAGLRAMLAAGCELFGPHFRTDNIEFAGRLDTLIIPEMFAQSNVELTPANYAAFQNRYRQILADLLREDSPHRTALPGVHALLARLRQIPSLRLGLLTGNFEETGAMKIASCGIDPAWFSVRVWCTDAVGTPPSRDELPRAAFRRYAEVHAESIAPTRVTVIGDSPHDIRCAKVNACRSLAVATGIHSLDELLAHVPDRAVQDLSQTDDLVAWLTSAA